MFDVITKKQIELKGVTYTLQVIRPQFKVMMMTPLHLIMLMKEVTYGYTVEGVTALNPDVDIHLALHDMGVALLKGEEHLSWWFMAAPWTTAPVVGSTMRNYRQVDDRHIARLLTICNIDISPTAWGKQFLAHLGGQLILQGAYNGQHDMSKQIQAKLYELESYRLFRLLNTQDEQWSAAYVQTKNNDVRHALANQAFVLPLTIPNFPFTVVIFMGQQYAKLCMQPELECYNIAVVHSDLVRSFLQAIPTYMEPVVV